MKNFIDEIKAQQQHRLISNFMLHNFVESNLIDHISTLTLNENSLSYILNALCPELWQHLPLQHAQQYDDLPTSSLDLIVNIMMLHRVNDPRLILQQAVKLLKPKGIFLTAFLGGDTLNELRQTLIQTDMHFYKGAYQRFIPMIHPQSACNLLSNCGLYNPIIDHKKIQCHYSNLQILLSDLRGFGERGYLNQDISNPPVTRHYYQHAQDLYQQNFSTNQGKLIATYDVIFATGWRQ